jgi:hypothetical protein
VEKHNSYLAIADHLTYRFIYYIFFLFADGRCATFHSLKVYLAGFMCEDAQILFMFLLCFQKKKKIISQAY